MIFNRSKIEREKKTVSAMVRIVCDAMHQNKGQPLCADCRAALDYALERLDKCPFGNNKPTCANCEIHCYQPAMREKIKNVMRFAGPRMIRKHPLMALSHLLNQRVKRAANKKRSRS